MKYWFWVLAFSLLGLTSAKADFVILRVILSGDGQGSGMGMQGGGMLGIPSPPGGMLGLPSPPGGMGGFPAPPGGMFGMLGNRGGPMPPGGMGGFPAPPGGMMGIRGGFPTPPGGMGGFPAPPGGMGGFPAPPGGMGGFPAPPGGMGGVGFGGVPPGGFGGVPPMGMFGMTGQPQVRVGPDDYVMVAVDIKDKSFQAIPGGRIYHRENIGIPGHFSFQSKYGTTFVNVNQGDIRVTPMLDVDDPKKQHEIRYKKLSAKPSPEAYLEHAEWCLSVGLVEEAKRHMAYVASAHGGRPETKPHVAAVIAAFNKVKDIIDANVETKTKAEQWQKRMRLGALSESKHYAIAHFDSPIAQESATNRLEHLENNFKTFYLWFALRGRALPGPTEKLPAVIVSESRDFRNYRDTFEATNVVVDGFHARRENLAVFSLHRLDKASVNFQQTVGAVKKAFDVDALFKPTLPDLKANPNAPKFDEYARMSMLALVDKALREEAEIASASHEGTKQLFAETGLLPRNVLAPEWLRFGTAALFEMPKGPFPGESSQVKVAFYQGGGGPSWAYMRYFEEMRDKGLLSDSASAFRNTVFDRDFSLANEMAKRSLDQKRRGEEGDSKETPAEILAERARTLSWALVFFLAKDKFAEFEVFLQELAKLPRDAELDAIAVAKAFAVAFRINSAALDGEYFDSKKFAFIGNEWMQFMGRQQSPTRNLKLDALMTSGGGGMNMGGGPGVPGFPGGGLPGAGGGLPGGGFPGPMGPGLPGGGGPGPGFPGGGGPRPPGR